MKKTFTVLLVVLLIASVFMAVSCSKGETTAKSSAKKETVKIQVMVGFGTGTDPSQIAVHEELQNEFNSTIGKEKGIELEFVTVQYSDAAQKFTTLLSAKMAPDICGPVGVMGVANFIDEWEDLTPYLERDNYDLSVFDMTEYTKRFLLSPSSSDFRSATTPPPCTTTRTSTTEPDWSIRPPNGALRNGPTTPCTSRPGR